MEKSNQLSSDSVMCIFQYVVPEIREYIEAVQRNHGYRDKRSGRVLNSIRLCHGALDVYFGDETNLKPLTLPNCRLSDERL